MLRFSPPKSTLRSRTGRWPETERPRRRTVFSPRPSLEILIVMIDADLIDNLTEPPPYTPQVLLAGLLTHECVTTLRYSDAGPPAGLLALPGRHAPTGWVAVGVYNAERNARGLFFAPDDQHMTEAIIHGNPEAAAAFDADNPAYADRGTEDAELQRRLDRIAAKAAERIEADIFITKRPYLHTPGKEFADGVLIATPDEALPLVSLYLRAQGAFVSWRDRAGKTATTLNAGSFYAAGAIELAPNTWTLLLALSQHAQNGGPPELHGLAQAVLGRLQQAITQRDVMYRALNRPQNNDVAEEALTAFDMALLALMGATDSSASIADQLLGLQGGDVGWQVKSWRKEARAASPAIDQVFQAGDHQHLLKILTALRNTIHGEQMDPLTVGSPSKVEMVVELPPEKVPELRSAMNNLGGTAAWGVDSEIPGRYHADPGTLLDQLITRTAALLDAVSAALPVIGLAGVQTPSQPLARPIRLSMFENVPGESILWLLGLSP